MLQRIETQIGLARRIGMAEDGHDAALLTEPGIIPVSMNSRSFAMLRMTILLGRAERL
jgi:hypothetical protein